MIAALLLRAPLPAALALAPGISTTAVVLSAATSSAVGVPWGALPLIVGVLAVWLTAATLGALLHRHTPQEEPHRLPIAELVATAIAAVAVAAVLLPVSRTPEAFPQHPDTIFHLGAAQWMVEHHDASFLHVLSFSTTSGGGFYPAAFHAMVATTALLSGAPVVVATSSFVLVIAGVAWPLGCVFLARTLFGSDLAVTISAAVASVAFSAYPFMLMGFGVLWPLFFGMALIPSALALLAVVVSAADPQSAPMRSKTRAILLLLVIVAGIALVHPNAFVTFLLFGYLMVAGVVLGRAWEMRRDRPRRAAATVLGLVMATALAFFASTLSTGKSSRMMTSGARGPELPSDEAVQDMLLLAPRDATELRVLALLVVVGGIIILMRYRGRRWPVAAVILTSALFYVNVAVDSPTARLFTWPWNNNAVRLAAIVVLPATLLVTVALATGARLLQTRTPLPRWASAVAMPLLFLVATGGYVTAHRNVLNPFFHPVPSSSWASNAELRALHRLARYVPPDAVVAENAWNGGSYMYVVSGRHMLFPTEKAREPGDRMLLALRLDDVGTSPEVCAAARRQHVQFAITGGRPFAWARKRGTTEYAGVDAVGSSNAFRKVARDDPYTLYQMVKCASG
ncbi:MAG: hypothetical protein IMZ75_17140 [Actinobacteria bacterium]|nr:hypothetical protein [Actinomycetota bacterium]